MIARERVIAMLRDSEGESECERESEREEGRTRSEEVRS